jgi:signal transduction histidine kinase
VRDGICPMGVEPGVARTVARTAEQELHGRKFWRVFLIATAVMILGGAVQLYLPNWHLNPQIFLATKVVVEVSRAALCFFIFGVRWMTREFRADSRTLFISSVFLALGILTVARLLTFPGMPLAGNYSELVKSPYFGTYSNFSESLYYDAFIRLSLAGLLLVGALMSPDRPVKRSSMKFYPIGLVAFAAVGIFIVSAVDVLPRLYIQGEGMTTLDGEIDIIAVALSFISALTFAFLASRSRETSYAIVSIGLLLLTEAQIASYKIVGPLDAFFLASRIMSLAAYFIIFMGVVKPSLVRPYLNLEASKRDLDVAAENLATLSRSIMERRDAEERIMALNADLQLSNKELESFCYSVSHDLRAPLRTIDGFSRFLMEEEGSKLSEQGRQYVARMRNGCLRMGAIIEDLLKLSRVAREEFVKKEFDITALAIAVADEIGVLNPHRNLEFVACGPEIVDGDEGKIRIALENLLNNAWKFTSKTDHARVEFGVKTLDGDRVFFVKDNGAGFDMRYYSKMFRPFERLHTEAEFPGIGVGLATVQRVVERHGGRIWAEGKVSEGATFFFTLGGRPPTGQVLNPQP